MNWQSIFIWRIILFTVLLIFVVPIMLLSFLEQAKGLGTAFLFIGVVLIVVSLFGKMWLRRL